MQIHPKIASVAAITAQDEWVKVPEACEILQCKPSRIYEILTDLETEDPEHIVRTFLFKSPSSSRGTRLFEKNSLLAFMAFRYAQAEAQSQLKKLEQGRCRVIA